MLQIGSFAETIGPRYGLGWIINKRLRKRLNEQFFLDETANVDVVLQAALVSYFQKRSYDKHLRVLREKLARRMRRGIEILRASAPPSCAISDPTGGFMCWVRVSSNFNAFEAARKAVTKGISIPPGSLFSVTGSFRNFVGLNLSFPSEGDYLQRLNALVELLSVPSD